MRFLKEALTMLIVWIGVLIVALAVLEIAFRVLRHEPDPLAHITQQQSASLFRPDTVLHNVSSVPGEFDYQARINRDGYRGKDLADPKPAGVLRIFAVGDSFTFGVGSADDATIPALLEKDLKAAGVPAEVVNAGVGGAGTLQHYRNLEHIHMAHGPDAVLLFFDLTDLWDDWYAERHAVHDRSGRIDRFDPMFINGRRDWWITATYYSALARYFHNKVVRSIRKMNALGLGNYVRAVSEGKRAKALIANAAHEKALRSAIEYDGLLFMRGREREGLIREHWARTERYLLKIRDLLAAKNIPLVIVMYPHGTYVDGDQWKEGRRTWGFEQGRRYDDLLPFDMMRDFCAANRIPWVNTLDAFLRAPKDKYFFDWDGHMTARGNVLVADHLAQSPVLQAALAQARAHQEKP